MSAHTGACLPAQKRSALSLGRTPRCHCCEPGDQFWSIGAQEGRAEAVAALGGRAGRGREDPQLASEGHEVREEM